MTMLDLEMNALDIAHSVAHLGVNWLIQSSLLIVAGLWIGAALRSKGSAAQSAVYRTTLAAVLVCPLVSWGLSQFGATGWSLEMPAAYTQEEVFSQLPQDANTGPAVELEPVVATDTEIPSFEALENTAALESSSPNEFPVNEPPVDLAPPAVIEDEDAAVASAVPAPTATVSTNWFGISATVAGITWLLLGGGLLARLAHSWRQLIRIRRSAAAADPATIETCRNVAELFRVAPPTVLHSPFLPSPCLAGLHKPAVLLPDDELSLPMRDVLIHELAHLAHGDCYWNLLRRIGTSLLFFQPLVWLLSRRLDSTAEEVCDDYVVQFGGDRREYAHRLVDIAELSVAPLAAAGVGIVSLRSMLAARVARIMDTSRSLSTRVGHALLTLVLLAGLVGTILVGLVGVEPDRAAAEANAEAEDQPDESVQPSEIDIDAGSTSDNEATATRAITGTIQAVDSEASLEPANEDDAQPLTKVHGRVVVDADQPVPGALVRVMRNTLSLKNEHELLDEQRGRQRRFRSHHARGRWCSAVDVPPRSTNDYVFDFHCCDRAGLLCRVGRPDTTTAKSERRRKDGPTGAPPVEAASRHPRADRKSRRAACRRSKRASHRDCHIGARRGRPMVGHGRTTAHCRKTAQAQLDGGQQFFRLCDGHGSE